MMTSKGIEQKILRVKENPYYFAVEKYADVKVLIAENLKTDTL